MSAVTKPRDLRLTPLMAAPVRERGRLMLPAEVARDIFGGMIGRKWVMQHAPVATRVRLGRLVCYYEAEMVAWRDSLGGTVR